MIDRDTEFGARAADHLTQESVVWLTSVTKTGAPLPRPVWFLWDDDETVTIYSMPGARVRNIEANPQVTLNFGGDGNGGDIVVFSGTATLAADAPPASANAAYVAKYSEGFTRLGSTPEKFSERYSVLVTIKLTALNGH
jgi:PPOX class probable F420-dependent enzyme